MGERIISVRKVVYSKESFDVSVDTSGWVSNPHPPPPPYPILMCCRRRQMIPTPLTTYKAMGGGWREGRGQGKGRGRNRKGP